MEKMKVRDLMVPVDSFPRISVNAGFYDALQALEDAHNEYVSGEAGERILLVESEKGETIGKLSPMDLLRGLETNYTRADSEKVLTSYGYSNIWKSFQEDYNLWETPFRDLCRKATQVHLKSFLKGPSEGQTVGMNDPLAKCFHRFVMNRHDALFVVEGDQIVGLLKFSDVYKEVLKTMKECGI